MSGDAVLLGSCYYKINPSNDTVQLSINKIENISTTSGTGTIRLELWVTTTPWNPGFTTGYKIATDQVSGPSNGTLGPDQYFSNISTTVAYNPPPAGTYYVTLAAAEYTGVSPSIDNGFVIDSGGSGITFQNLLVVNSNGSVSQGGALPSVPSPVVPVVGSFIANPGQSVSISSLFTETANINNPMYLDVCMCDRNEYPGGITPLFGTFKGNGTIGTVYEQTVSGFLISTYTNIDETAIVFTYQASSGRYYNSTYGYFDRLTFITGNTVNENAEISVFTTNNYSILSASPPGISGSASYDTQYLAGLASTNQIAYNGTVDVVNGTAPAPTQASPDLICAAAKTYVGKIWNDNGCWVLASDIAAKAGSSLPASSLQVNTQPIHNGEWIVAYNGFKQSSPTIASAESVLRPGDIVSVTWSGGGGHITTVVSGYGANAQVIDNQWTGTNSANDGVASDLVIVGPHSLNSELIGNGAIPSSIVVYRLDTPTITVNTPSENILAAASISLSPFFTANDAGGAGSLPITEYAFYDVGTGSAKNDNFSVNGITETAHAGGSAIVVSASSLSSVNLQAAPGAGGTDTVYVSAFNGSYWGDWSSILFQVNSITNIVNLTTPNATISATQSNEQINGNSGINTVDYSGTLSNYTITQSGSSFVVQDNTGVDGMDTLTNIQRLHFTDMSVALDVNGGNAGITAEVLGVVFGAPSVSNTVYAGIGLNLLDGGMNFQNLMQLALNVKLGIGFTNTQEVQLLYHNLLGVAAGQSDIAYWNNTINSGRFTQASLAVMAAETSFNTININLVGLKQHGLEYTPVA